MYTYKVTFFTGKQSWSGTNANIHLTIYGTDGESENVIFENEGKTMFESGMKNSFTVDTKHSLGTLTKVRVGHDNTGFNPGWFLEKLEVQDIKTGEVSEFECYKWFASDTGDRKIRRDVRRTGISMETVAVETLQKKETVVAEQHIELKQNTGPVVVNITPTQKQENFSAPELNSEPKEDMVVEEVTPTEKEENFEAPNLDELFGQDSQETNYKYNLTFHTGPMAFAGTNANVVVTIYDKDETSQEFKFENKAGNLLFEKGMKNSFPIDSKIPLESVAKIRVGHDNTGVFPGWYIIEVVLEDTSSGEKEQFPCNEWLAAKKWFENEVVACVLTRDTVDGLIPTPSSTEELHSEPDALFTIAPTKQHFYTVHLVSEVSYGNLGDDQIIFTLYGKDGESEEQKFDQKERSFEKRMRGTIKIECSKHLGSIDKIKIGLDNTKGACPWILVMVVDHKLNESVVFICDCCLVNNRHAHVPHKHYSVFVDAKNEVTALDKDDCKDWPIVKQTKDGDVRSRSSNSPNTPPIIKAVLKLDDVSWPYKTAVKSFTDWAEREKWDKTLSNVNILEKIEGFTLVQCSLKMPLYATSREVVIACLDHTDQRYHMQIMCNTLHPRVLMDSKKIRAKTFKSGIVIHQSEDEPKSASITVISQVELGGWMIPKAKADYLENVPVKQLEFFKSYVNQRKDIVENGNADTGSDKDRKQDTPNGI